MLKIYVMQQKKMKALLDLPLESSGKLHVNSIIAYSLAPVERQFLLAMDLFTVFSSASYNGIPFVPLLETS